MSSRTIDLHCHSIFSDGSDSPTTLIDIAKAQGLATLAITDHDTVAGLEEAGQAAQKAGLELIPGVELAAQSSYGEVHILGYWIDAQNATLRAALENLRDGRYVRNQEIVRRLQDSGVDIDYATVESTAFTGEFNGSIGRPHIARVLVKNGCVKDIQEAFTRYLALGASAYVPRALPTLAAVMQLLTEVQATSSLAHIGLSKTSRQGLIAIVDELAAHGLHAIEAYHTEHSPEMERFCVDQAMRLGLCLTGGSDYHGTTKPRTRLGVGKGNLRIPHYLLEKLKEQRIGLGLSIT